MQSITVGALIVIDVHAKDVVEKLADEDIDSISSFEWISQLRYYWRDDDCWVQCVQTDFPYGYEYLGNTFRLVITPLTDMCYMTLMGAQQLNLGKGGNTRSTNTKEGERRSLWHFPSGVAATTAKRALLSFLFIRLLR